MSLPKLIQTLQKSKAKIVYIIHAKNLGFSEMLDVRRFADKLRAKGFIPLIADDFRQHGETCVQNAIAASNYSVILAFDQKTVEQARSQGVPFVEATEI